MGDIYNDSKYENIVNGKSQIGIDENYKSRNTRYNELYNKYYDNKNKVKEKDNKMNSYYDNKLNEILRRRRNIIENNQSDEDPRLVYPRDESNNSQTKRFNRNITDVINKYRNSIGNGHSRIHSKKKKNINNSRYTYCDERNMSISNDRNMLLNTRYNLLENPNKNIIQIDDRKKINLYKDTSALDNFTHHSYRNQSKTSQWLYESKNHNERTVSPNYYPTDNFSIKQKKNKIDSSNIINSLSRGDTNINDDLKYYKNGRSQYKDEIGRYDAYSHLSLYSNFGENNFKNNPDFFQKCPSESLCVDNYKMMLKKGSLVKPDNNMKHTRLKGNNEIYSSSELGQSDMDRGMKYEKPFYRLSNHITDELETEDMGYSHFLDKEKNRKKKIKNKLKSMMSRRNSVNEKYDNINRPYTINNFNRFENSSQYSDDEDGENSYNIGKYDQSKDKIYKNLNCSDAITKYKSNTSSLYNDKNTILNTSQLENYDQNRILINSYSGNPYFIDNKFDHIYQNDERKFKERKNYGKKNMIDTGHLNNIDAESVNSNNVKSTQLHISRISHGSNDFSTLYDYSNNSKYRHSNNNRDQSIGTHKRNQYLNRDKINNLFLENNKMSSTNLHTTNCSDTHKSIHNSQYTNYGNYGLNENNNNLGTTSNYYNNWEGSNTLLSASHFSTKNKTKRKSKSRNNSQISREYIFTQNDEMENNKCYNDIDEEDHISLSNKHNEILNRQGKYPLNDMRNSYNYHPDYAENYNDMFCGVNIFSKNKKKKNMKKSTNSDLPTKLKKEILLDSLLNHDDEDHEDMGYPENGLYAKEINQRGDKLKKRYSREEDTNNPHTYQYGIFNNLKHRLFTRPMHIDDLNGDNYDANYDVNYGEPYDDSNYETNYYYDYTQRCNSKNINNYNESFYEQNNQNNNKKFSLSSLYYQEIFVLILIYIFKMIYYIIYYIFHFFKQFSIYLFNKINRVSPKYIIISVIVSLPFLLFVLSSLLLSYRSLNIDYYDRDI
ncbi:conserved Plasmodium protein, unknown function [Plasmodium vinckei vinckei]|uniref:Uncharacterized protein n=1 Tax=Plasmodium vinckei vinckei TaxID=54757 RepID=A0A449BU25_PLAVN|nr:conserved Plasmodium protein, unknown function [Plasmodium vinckei vinckei]KEG03170.1 hypothetical protein YYE_02104 [Plasmodium vinckei vinckei]VEV56977.1 conserved Plasmodium protein, unknown function [Plasmodium vinckei vinckei]